MLPFHVPLHWPVSLGPDRRNVLFTDRLRQTDRQTDRHTHTHTTPTCPQLSSTYSFLVFLSSAKLVSEQGPKENNVRKASK